MSYDYDLQTEYGDIYDCIDIYKQPAFDHPALKNHKIQMESTSYPEGMKREISLLSNTTKVLNIGLPDGGCPKGTVPIRRIQKADAVRRKPLKTSAFLNGMMKRILVDYHLDHHIYTYERLCTTK
ncbi:Nep-interacting protein [Thalictrum thalictroides]|uniref:Nep-interacting protein n=1 Tax=Thalictrum thalictroides TaxID=46969 RepID=A0A7J6WM31_THATH|nr:Nep-interacting protein [Thalictrum thalictroides]